MPKAKNYIQDMSINNPRQNISVKITFYFNILIQSILDFFLRIALKVIVGGIGLGGDSLTSHESIIHWSGPLVRSRDANDENLAEQYMSAGSADPFAEQCPSHLFSILQTRIPANKEKADAVWLRKGMYFKNKQPRTKKE